MMIGIRDSHSAFATKQPPTSKRPRTRNQSDSGFYKGFRQRPTRTHCLPVQYHRRSRADMVDRCQYQNSSAEPHNRRGCLFCITKLMVGAGSFLTTVAYTDIRGLVTAFHGFVVELPLSYVGDSATALLYARLEVSPYP